MKKGSKKSYYEYDNFSIKSIEEILCILEKIKKAGELAIIGYFQNEKVKIVKIPVSKLKSSCNINWYDVENILKKLQEEKIIKGFENVHPFV